MNYRTAVCTLLVCVNRQHLYTAAVSYTSSISSTKEEHIIQLVSSDPINESMWCSNVYRPSLLVRNSQMTSCL